MNMRTASKNHEWTRIYKNPAIAEVNRRAEAILMQQLGVADTLRFLNQFSCGVGDYTVERHEWLDAFSLDDVIQDIETNRKRNMYTSSRLSSQKMRSS